jgi:hypothetical protein
VGWPWDKEDWILKFYEKRRQKNFGGIGWISNFGIRKIFYPTDFLKKRV